MFKNMKMVKKLVTAFVLVTIIASISGIMGVYLFAKTDADYSAALVDYGFAQGKIGKLGMEINQGAATIRDIVFLEDEQSLNEANAKLQTSAANADKLVEEVRSTNITEEGKKLFAKIEADLATYRGYRAQVLEFGMANNQERAHAIWINQAAPVAEQISADIDALLEMKISAGTTASDNLTASGRLMLAVMIGAIIAGAVIAIAFAIFIARSISRPIIEIEAVANKMAQGNYDTSTDYEARDEIGSLAESMRQMLTTTSAIIDDTARGLAYLAEGNFDIEPQVEYIGVFSKIRDSIMGIITKLTATLSQIQTSSDQVSIGADQVSDSAQSLSQGATEQASSVEQLSASINQVSEQLKLSAENSRQASQKASLAGAEIGNSNKQMADMIVAMDLITEKSSEIGKIIKSIDDIAFQTNILALNAAVEAARAGAAGKGFAVVADEVRNLAGKSAEAAKTTASLIEESIKAVENGSKIANDTAITLNGTVTVTQDALNLIDKISEATSEQAQSISQINIGVEQIASVVQTNSATAEESAAASEELSGQANMLKELMTVFKLRTSSNSNQSRPGQAHTASPQKQNQKQNQSNDFTYSGPADQYSDPGSKY